MFVITKWRQFIIAAAPAVIVFLLSRSFLSCGKMA
jgi:hypothetical protein